MLYSRIRYASMGAIEGRARVRHYTPYNSPCQFVEFPSRNSPLISRTHTHILWAQFATAIAPSPLSITPAHIFQFFVLDVHLALVVAPLKIGTDTPIRSIGGIPLVCIMVAPQRGAYTLLRTLLPSPLWSGSVSWRNISR